MHAVSSLRDRESQSHALGARCVLAFTQAPSRFGLDGWLLAIIDTMNRRV
jgi:hypothetical protein